MPNKIIRFIFALALIHTPFATALETNTSFVEITDILYNPGIGLSNFHHQSEFPTPTDARPSGKVAYYRFYWSELESATGEIDTTLIDRALATTAARGQLMGLRIISATLDNNDKYVPAWVLQEVANAGSGHTPGWELPVIGSSPATFFMPNYNEPIIVNAAAAFLAELGRRYGNHPNLYFVDIGMVGVWGEWHDGSGGGHMPSVENGKLYVDMHRIAFPKKALVMPIGTGSLPSNEVLQYAVDNYNAGWRGDCWGDSRFFDSAFNGYVGVYPTILNAVLNLDETWKSNPVIMESCGPVAELFGVSYAKPSGGTVTNDVTGMENMLNFAINHHVSSLNTMGWNAAIPSALRSRFQELAKSLGYRFVLKSVQYPAMMINGDPVVLKSTWENIGNAPVYDDFRISYRLRRDDGAIVRQWISPTYSPSSPGATNIRAWLPDNTDHTDTLFSIARDTSWHLLKTPAGTYKIDLAILWPQGNSPAISLAIAGRRDDGWYEVGETQLTTPVGIDNVTVPCNTIAAPNIIDADLNSEWNNIGQFNCGNVILELSQDSTGNAPPYNAIAYKDKYNRILAIATADNYLDVVNGNWTQIATCNTVGSETEHHLCSLPNNTTARYVKLYLNYTPNPDPYNWMVPTDIRVLQKN